MKVRITAFIERRSLALILALGLIVRLMRIGSRGLEYDDTFSIFLSERSLPEIVRGTAADTMPPLYYFLLHFWMGLGSWLGIAHSAWFLRLLSVLFSLIAVYLLYQLVLLLFSDRRSALLAGLLASISPFQYYHAQDVRNYALLLCAELGYLIFFVRIWKGGAGKWVNWLGLVLCALAGMYTHNVAVFALGLPNLFLLMQRRWKLFGQLVIAQLGIGLLTLPWLLELPGQLAKVQRAWWLWQPGLIDFLQIPVVWSAGLPLPGIWLWIGIFLGLEILAILLIETFKIRGETGIVFLALITLGLPVLLVIGSYLIRPIFVPRAFILASMSFYGLAGGAIVAGWKKGGGKILLGGLLAAALIGLPAQAEFNSFPRSPFEEAAKDLAGRVKANELVVHDNKLSYFPFRFYQPDLRSSFVADEPGSGNDTFALDSQKAMAIFPAQDLETAVGNSQGIYFVLFNQAIQDYKAIGVVRHPALDWLDQHYHFVDHMTYNDLEVFYYTRP